MSAKSRKPAKETPFYELPNVTTSADIIAAARHSIRTVDTRRPEVRSQTLYLIITFQVWALESIVFEPTRSFTWASWWEPQMVTSTIFQTPKEGNRTLFGDRSTARPPSSYHINKAAFKEPISRSTTLSPIESLGSKEKLESSKTNSPVLESKSSFNFYALPTLLFKTFYTLMGFK